MWERTLSRKIVDKLCEQDVIVPSDVAAYVYGYELLISSVISVLIVEKGMVHNEEKFNLLLCYVTGGSSSSKSGLKCT